MISINIFIIGVSLILGLLIGSFLNVVALRFNTGKSLGGRSGCFSCGNQLSWYELVPVFSWLIQKGRCRNCSSRITPMYVFGEATTAIFFAAIAARGLLGGIDFLTIEYLVSTLFLFIVTAILVVIFLYDIRHKIIPDSLSLSFGIITFIALFYFGFDQNVFTLIGWHIPEWYDILAGVFVPLPFVLIWIISKGKWIGLGDPKLMVGMGFLFGLQRGISSVFISFWIGALFALALVIVNKLFKKQLLRSGKKSIMKEEIPFAPFLITAVVVTLVFGLNLFTL